MSEEKKSIGALWLKESRNGTEYMSGIVEVAGEEIQVVVFRNNYKKKDNQPDYRIFESEPRREREPDPEQQKVAAPSMEQDLSDDMPF